MTDDQYRLCELVDAPIGVDEYLTRLSLAFLKGDVEFPTLFEHEPELFIQPIWDGRWVLIYCHDCGDSSTCYRANVKELVDYHRNHCNPMSERLWQRQRDLILGAPEPETYKPHSNFDIPRPFE